MSSALALDQMTTAEKLRALEGIWADLLRNSADVPVPAWHRDVLDARQHRVEEGTSTFSAWPEAIQRLRDRDR